MQMNKILAINKHKYYSHITEDILLQVNCDQNCISLPKLNDCISVITTKVKAIPLLGRKYNLLLTAIPAGAGAAGHLQAWDKQHDLSELS